ncbi:MULTISPECIES: Na+/H+ antiporter subunit G [Pseudoalteromonas]|uniref:Cation:proton antiporter n=1 Tax=Pseudoalteromonas ruthenica TaxID=151081 RepID=A0A0F4PZ83_9GAMM|nr:MULTISPECIES: Na+/H+ antiporter subunit G [Pseudoalteromonas]KJZ00791.1 cation:proton antiporter [Pseudoalteromonas ruthenica]KJZ01156.1 cation:proton antiporter [Pseudoalteromonas ruthenica]MCF2863067.1 Na+/H+ antiporter subunit G [Pseudoalteromonas sp. CNAT2-18]MCG7543058.1 Na+/H+ antiporter subunit G [Pseudoalteromonas sp. MM17-2]MCG7559219.1 Na+/H+ antiporter subunit G [Pseudoalteromonas sp. CNAT2-18.1]|tara:strand:+ start:3976 stop:4305 length:330 start_codon:yes stop_codon:yes gene_type:complete
MFEWIIAAFLLAGGAFILIGSIGLVKMPDFFMRLHGPTKATTLGMASLLIAANVYFSVTNGEVNIKEILISIFLLITAPITGYMLIKSAIHHDLKAREDTKGLDKIEDD